MNRGYTCRGGNPATSASWPTTTIALPVSLMTAQTGSSSQVRPGSGTLHRIYTEVVERT